jgi:hypothetical protein
VLPDAEAFLERMGHPRVSIVDSAVRPEERRDRIERFAPVSNERKAVKGTEQEIQLLVSTDVLSEGQNLQDADVVINYDLHWNPVRMVQRAGRIDRLGSLFDIVHVYNFFPEDALESLLGIMQRLYEKLENINRAVGLDASVIGERPNPREFNALRRMAGEDASIWDELEGESELDVGEFLRQELLDFVKTAGEERLARMPKGVGSGIHKEGAKGLFVAIRDRVSNRHSWLYYDIGAGKCVGSKLQAIRMAKCSPGEKRVEPASDVYDMLARVKAHVLNLTKQVEHRVSALNHPQNAIANWLTMLPESDKRNELLDYFAKPLPGVDLKGLRELWRRSRQGEQELFSDLVQFAATHPHPKPEAPALKTPEAQDLEVVCWLALV